MKKAIIFSLVFSIININPVNANEECTSLTEEQIQSSINKVVEAVSYTHLTLPTIYSV